MVDTLVIGAGTAGCVVAARASADPRHTVRVVEAGPVWASAAQFPPQLRDATRLPLDDAAPWLWRYPVALTEERPGSIVRGRVAGGSGTINGCYFVRPPAADFTAWSQVAPGWSTDEVLPHFRELEHDYDYGDQPGHGSAGPVPVRRTTTPAPLTEQFLQACTAAGFTELADLNALPADSSASGAGLVPCNVGPVAGDGFRARVATAQSYLLPALSRPNLTVTGGTTVSTIRFRGGRAIGADCVRDGVPETVWADRVVVCAGAIESAALLLRSGIGPPEQLRALGIPVVQAAPVGRWCTDHPEIGIEYRHRAQLGRTVALESVLELGDIEIRPYTVAFAPNTRHLGIALMRPHGSGTLRLRSADPLAPPIIEYRYLTDAVDRTRLHEAAEVAGHLLDRMGAEPVGDIPDRDAAGAEHADGWLLRLLGTSQHLSGTCRMGASGDPRAVVDERCRVHGVPGLSVADLSIVPVPLGRGPQAATVMLAERAATFLRG